MNSSDDSPCGCDNNTSMDSLYATAGCTCIIQKWYFNVYNYTNTFQHIRNVNQHYLKCCLWTDHQKFSYRRNSTKSLTLNLTLTSVPVTHTHQFHPCLTDVLVLATNTPIILNVILCVHCCVLLSVQPCDLHLWWADPCDINKVKISTQQQHKKVLCVK